MRLDILVFTAAAFFLGYMAHEANRTPETVKLENLPFCLHSEYPTMKAMRADKPPLDEAMIDIGATVTVWVRCGD